GLGALPRPRREGCGRSRTGVRRPLRGGVAGLSRRSPPRRSPAAPAPGGAVDSPPRMGAAASAPARLPRRGGGGDRGGGIALAGNADSARGRRPRSGDGRVFRDLPPFTPPCPDAPPPPGEGARHRPR